MFTLKVYRQDTLHVRHYETINVNRGSEFLEAFIGDEKPYAWLYCSSGELVKDWPLHAGDRAYIVNSAGKTVESITGAIE